MVNFIGLIITRKPLWKIKTTKLAYFRLKVSMNMSICSMRNILIKISTAVLSALRANNMATKTVTIRIPEDLASWLSVQGESMNQTIVDQLNNARLSRAYGLAELKGKFTPNEWKFFADSLNGTIVKDQLRYIKGVLIASCEDSEALDCTASKCGVNLEVLKEKIYSLAASQVEALYSRVESFWVNSGDLDKWAEY